MSVAVGGVKVRVSARDAPDARAVLAAPAPDLGYEPPIRAEVEARQASTAVFAGYGSLPFTLWGAYKLAHVLARPGLLPTRTRRRLAWTAFVLGLWLASTLWMALAGGLW